MLPVFRTDIRSPGHELLRLWIARIKAEISQYLVLKLSYLLEGGASTQRASMREALLPQKPLIQPVQPVVTLPVFVHAPGVEELAQVRRLGMWVYP